MYFNSIHNFYNKGFGPVKKATYRNLMKDLSDNPESLYHLYRFKKSRNTQIGLCIAGGVALLAAAITLYNKTSGVDNEGTGDNPNLTTPATLACMGVACLGVSYVSHFQKPGHIRKAVDVYNR